MILRDINFKTNCVEELNERRQERTASATIYAKNKAHSSSVEECEYWYDHKSISNLENDYEAPLVSKIGNVSYITSKYMLGSDYVRPRLYYSVEALK